jgi:hypothetical protein
LPELTRVVVVPPQGHVPVCEPACLGHDRMSMYVLGLLLGCGNARTNGVAGNTLCTVFFMSRVRKGMISHMQADLRLASGCNTKL